MIKEDRGTPFSVTATASGAATATQNGVALQTIYITDIAGSSDLSGATLQLKDGSTVIWQARIGNSTAYQESFSMPIKATAGATVTLVATGTAYGAANIAGFIINNS